MSKKATKYQEMFTKITGQTSVTEPQQPRTLRIGDNLEDRDGLPSTHIDCPECGHDRAKWYMQQTRSADESETRFFICVACRNKWRDYD